MNRCKICGGLTAVTHQGTILLKHPVAYHLCRDCDYWCTDEPFWLEEAYSQAIVATDTGLVQRNLAIAGMLRALLAQFFPKGPYVDWAGSHGMLVRLMRDYGFDFYWQDLYADNLLAQGFDWDRNRSGEKATVVTAIEVLEHAPDPAVMLRECLSGSGADAVIFSQELHSGGGDHDWWYLSPVTGQHVSFFSRRTLRVLADQLDMHLQSADSLHLMTRVPLSARRLRVALRTARLSSRLLDRRRTPFTWLDHLEMTERLTRASRS